MKSSINFSSLIDRYLKDEKLKTFNPVANLAGFPAVATQLIIRSVIIASVINLIIVGLLIYFSLSWTLIILGILIGLVSSIALSITIALKLVSHAFLDEIQKLLLGLLQPIEKLYGYYQESGIANLSKEDFAKKFLKESIVPMAFQKTRSFPFKGQLEKIFIELIEQIDIKKLNKESISLNESLSQPLLNTKAILDPVFFNKMRVSINTNVNTLKSYGKMPLNTSIKIVSAAWSIIWVSLFLLGQY